MVERKWLLSVMETDNKAVKLKEGKIGNVKLYLNVWGGSLFGLEAVSIIEVPIKQWIEWYLK